MNASIATEGRGVDSPLGQGLHSARVARAMDCSDSAGPLFEQLYALNQKFLGYLQVTGTALVVPNRDQSKQPLSSNPLSRLSAGQRSAIARCPYALFDLKFSDDALWRAVMSIDGEPTVHAIAHSSISVDFVEVVLFFAWHAAQADPNFARFALGMSEFVLAKLQSWPVTGLKRLAASAVAWLMPRWINNAYFWPDLIRFAATNATPQLHAAQLLGCQLHAMGSFTPRVPVKFARSVRAVPS